MTIQYFNRVDVKREKLPNIENALVRSFWKSSIIDVESFNDVECDILKEVLIEDYQEEVNQRISDGKTNLTKIKLVECLPEDADYVSVAYSIRSTFVSVNDITSVKADSIYTIEEIEQKYKDKKNHLPNHTSKNPIIKWV